MGLISTLFGSYQEEDDAPGPCGKCGQEHVWDEEEGAYTCACGVATPCTDCGAYSEWDEDMQRWGCGCGFELAPCDDCGLIPQFDEDEGAYACLCGFWFDDPT